VKDGADTRVLLALGVTILIWASAFAGIRAGLEAYSPGHLALLRFLVGSGLLVVYATITRMARPAWRDLPAVLLGGFLGFTVYHVGLAFGQVTVEAGSASLIIASVPVFTALLAAVFLGERLGLLGWIGTSVSFAGVALISAGEGGELGIDPGALPILLAAVSESLFFVFQKPYLQKYGSLRFTTFAIWAGTAVMLVFAPGLSEAVREAPLEATLSVVYLGVFPTVIAYLALAYAFARMPASNATSFLYLVPGLAFVIAWAWLGEVPTALSVVGGVIALSGVVLVNAKGRRRRGTR
jgi:drug/metabolite transporter (DMT)-like permease